LLQSPIVASPSPKTRFQVSTRRSIVGRSNSPSGELILFGAVQVNLVAGRESVREISCRRTPLRLAARNGDIDRPGEKQYDGEQQGNNHAILDSTRTVHGRTPRRTGGEPVGRDVLQQTRFPFKPTSFRERIERFKRRYQNA
jgi:hypothetical protein